MNMSRAISTAGARTSRRQHRGFTVLELLIAVAIVSILATIAVPSYTKSIVKSKRRAAQTCLSSFATQMERYYTTNLRYCADDNADGTCDSTTFALPTLDCGTNSNTGKDYEYSVTVSSSTYTVSAAPKTNQSSRDGNCGILSLTQAGTKAASGTDGVAGCW